MLLLLLIRRCPSSLERAFSVDHPQLAVAAVAVAAGPKLPESPPHCRSRRCSRSGSCSGCNENRSLHRARCDGRWGRAAVICGRRTIGATADREAGHFSKQFSPNTSAAEVGAAAAEGPLKADPNALQPGVVDISLPKPAAPELPTSPSERSSGNSRGCRCGSTTAAPKPAAAPCCRFRGGRYYCRPADPKLKGPFAPFEGFVEPKKRVLPPVDGAGRERPSLTE